MGQFFLAENESHINNLPEYVWQIWLRSDGRVEKKGGIDKTDKGTLQLFIVHPVDVSKIYIFIYLYSTCDIYPSTK